MDRTITAPIDRETLKSLHAGDYVYISGTIYTARDAAHKRMIETLDEGRELPLDLKDNVIYYMGPSPAREGRPIGSAGPEVIAYDDLGTEAIRKLTVENMPMIVVIDSEGNNLYETAVKEYQR